MNGLHTGTPALRLAGAAMAVLLGLVSTAQAQETALVKVGNLLFLLARLKIAQKILHLFFSRPGLIAGQSLS